MKRKGAETAQNTMKPTNSYPVVTEVKLAGRNSGIVANDGQMAVMQMATRRPPFQH